MQWRTVFSNNGFPKYSWAQVAIFVTVVWQFLRQCCLRARRSWAFNSGFRVCPVRTEISPNSQNLFTVLCTVDVERKFSAILDVPSELTNNPLTSSGTKGWATAHPHLQRQRLWWMRLLYPIMIPPLLPIVLFNVESSQVCAFQSYFKLLLSVSHPSNSKFVQIYKIQFCKHKVGQ